MGVYCLDHGVESKICHNWDTNGATIRTEKLGVTGELEARLTITWNKRATGEKARGDLLHCLSGCSEFGEQWSHRCGLSKEVGCGAGGALMDL